MSTERSMTNSKRRYDFEATWIGTCILASPIVVFQLYETYRAYRLLSPALESYNVPVKELINMYLNGTLPMSIEEWWRLGGHGMFLHDKIRNTMMSEWERELLRDERMSAEMDRLMTANPETRYFFAVGFAHLTYHSPTIQSRLEDIGYVVERIVP